VGDHKSQPSAIGPFPFSILFLNRPRLQSSRKNSNSTRTCERARVHSLLKNSLCDVDVRKSAAVRKDADVRKGTSSSLP
jgi:hypothetical protein